MSEKVNLDYLENHVFIGLRHNGVKAYLNQVVLETSNIVDGLNEIVIIGSDDLAPYMTIEGRGDDQNKREISFSVPYSMFLSDEVISKYSNGEVDYKLIGIEPPHSLSFGFIVEINAAGFTYKLDWWDDRLSLIKTIFGASFNFVKTN